MRMRGEYPSPIEQAASPEAEAAFQSRLFTLLSTPGLKLRRIAALLDAESYLVQEKTRGGSVLRFDVERYASDQRTTGRFAKLPDAYRPTQGVILPPGEGEIRSGEGKEPYRESEVIHRTKAVMDLLGGMEEPYDLVDGTTTSNMVRRLSYVAFVLKERGKLLLVNDEEGNATYVVHHLQSEGEAQEYLQSRKDDLRELMKRDPGLVSVLEFRSDMEAYVEEMQGLIERPYAAEPAREEPPRVASVETDKTNVREDKDGDLLPAPEGWLTINGLVLSLGKSDKWVQNRLKRLDLVHGRDARPYLDASRHVTDHYSPKIVEQLRELAQKHEQAPDGWMTAGALMKVLNKTPGWIQRRFKRLDLVQGRDVRPYLDRTGKQLPHYSPKIVEQLRELAQKHEQAPDGWMTMRGLKIEFKKADVWMQNRIRDIDLVHGRDVRPYLDTIGKVADHYSPKIVEQIRELAQKHEQAPDGWMTEKAIWQTVGKSDKWVRHRLEEIAHIEGRDFRTYLDRSGKRASHYSPDVVERLKKMTEE